MMEIHIIRKCILFMYIHIHILYIYIYRKSIGDDAICVD